MCILTVLWRGWALVGNRPLYPMGIGRAVASSCGLFLRAALTPHREIAPKRHDVKVSKKRPSALAEGVHLECYGVI